MTISTGNVSAKLLGRFPSPMSCNYYTPTCLSQHNSINAARTSCVTMTKCVQSIFSRFLFVNVPTEQLQSNTYCLCSRIPKHPPAAPWLLRSVARRNIRPEVCDLSRALRMTWWEFHHTVRLSAFWCKRSVNIQGRISAFVRTL